MQPHDDVERDARAIEIAALRARVAALEAENATLKAAARTNHAGTHQHDLEHALRESEARFAATFHVSPIGMVISTAAEGRILDVNARFLELFGRTRAGTIGQPSTAIGMWDDPADRAAVVEVLHREGHVRDLEVTVRGARDEPRRVLLSVEPIQIAGTPCLVTAVYDITSRVRTEASLRASETRLRAVIENAGVAIWSIDADYRLTMANAAFLETSRGQAGAEPQLGEQLPPAGMPQPVRDELRQLYARALAGEIVQDERITWTPSGELRSWESTYNPIVDTDGRVIGVACFGRDTTARKAAELALQQSEALYRTIARSLPDAAVFVVDREARYLLAEGPIVALLGLRHEQLEGHTPHELLDPVTAERAAMHFAAALDGEEITLEYTFAERVLWTHYTPLRRDDGQIWAAMALVLDITNRKELEAQLLQAQKMESIGQLAGGIAHDFNNLLTAIGGFAAMALEALPPDTPTHADLVEIQRATVRATVLTRQLLAFARRQRLEMRPLSLNALVVNVEQMLRRLIGEHIELVAQLAPDLGPVVADQGQLEQVLANLAVNARDAMPAGGRLTITTANVDVDPLPANGHLGLLAGRYVLLTVRDTGVGIAAEHQPHLFEPFFTTKPAGAGTGLGLATSYGIVRQHGGTMSISSAVGQGTLVALYLPRSEAEAAEQGAEAVPSARPVGTETVLLAEDEPAVRALTARLLRACGYTVLEAADGAEAVQVARAHAPRPIHLLLSDVVMPRVGGPTAAAQIHELYPAIRVLFMSGYTDLGSPLHVALRDAPYIQKPFSASTLMGLVRATLDQRPDDSEPWG